MSKDKHVAYKYCIHLLRHIWLQRTIITLFIKLVHENGVSLQKYFILNIFSFITQGTRFGNFLSSESLNNSLRFFSVPPAVEKKLKKKIPLMQNIVVQAVFLVSKPTYLLCCSSKGTASFIYRGIGHDGSNSVLCFLIWL